MYRTEIGLAKLRSLKFKFTAGAKPGYIMEACAPVIVIYSFNLAKEN